IFDLLRRCNKYVDETEPWKLGKDETKKERLATVLYNLLEGIRFSAILLEPYMPETAQKIFAQIDTKKTTTDTLVWGQYETEHNVIAKPEILFARLDVKDVMEKVEALKPAKPVAKKIEHKPEITIDDFAKVELLVGTVLSCEKHPKADKLLVSQIDLGGEVRQIVSGIAQYFKPEEMVGRKVVVVSNLKPANLRGVESQGMILAAADGKELGLVSVDMPDGTEVH
ncbi:MAG: methionine--tRNA ligase subunit beta, partial [Erysipelotrichaceae bacterium]|nr:methionine--tRNA ligase subunit beta [Erysipelotrichaceae bacterium]